MKRFISLLFVFIMLFSVSVNAIVPHSTVDELGINTTFIYKFKDENTYSELKRIVEKYNKEYFKYEINSSMDTILYRDYISEDYVVLAEFDKNYIEIDLKYIEESIKNIKVSKLLKYFVEELRNSKIELEYLKLFFDTFADKSPKIASIIYQVEIGITLPPIVLVIRTFYPLFRFLDYVVIIMFSLQMIYYLYFIIRYRKGKELNILKKKIRNLFVIFIFILVYILINGLVGVFSFISGLFL